MSEVEETTKDISPVKEVDAVEALQSGTSDEKDEGYEQDDHDESDHGEDDNDKNEESQKKDEQEMKELEKREEAKLKELEKQEEAKLKAKYPEMRSHGGASSLLQKRLSKGTKYFDSGDYNMAKAKSGAKPVIGPGQQKVMLPATTGETIPTPEMVPHKKIGLLQSKLVNLS